MVMVITGIKNMFDRTSCTRAPESDRSCARVGVRVCMGADHDRSSRNQKHQQHRQHDVMLWCAGISFSVSLVHVR